MQNKKKKTRALVIVLLLLIIFAITTAFALGAFPISSSQDSSSEPGIEQSNQNSSPNDARGDKQDTSDSSESKNSDSEDVQSTQSGNNAVSNTDPSQSQAEKNNKNTSSKSASNTSGRNAQNANSSNQTPAPNKPAVPTPAPNPTPNPNPQPTPNPDPLPTPDPNPDNPPIEQSYSLTFNLNSSDARWTTERARQNSIQSVTAQSILLLPAAAEVKRAGYVLVGWSKSKEASPKDVPDYTPHQGYTMPRENTTLYAIWKQAEYTVSYSGEGVTIPDKTKVHWRDAGLLPSVNPTRTDFEFVGWFTQVNGAGTKVTQQMTYATAAGDDSKTHLTLYAYWEALAKPDPQPDPDPEEPTPAKKTFKLTYDLQNGETTAPLPSTYTEGDAAIILSDNLTKTGYEFLGWSTDDNPTPQKRFTIPTTLTADLTLKANWKPLTYQLSYELDKGQLPAGASIPASYTIESDSITLPTPEREHYVFEGWADNAGNVEKVVVIQKGSTGNKSYTARWKAINYSVSYNLAGGTISGSSTIADKTDAHWDSSNLLPGVTPIKEGFTFEGWYTQENGAGTPVAESTRYSELVGNQGTQTKVTLYAYWRQKPTPQPDKPDEPKTFNITYDLQNGTEVTALPKTYTQNTQAITLPNDVTRTGYTFDGWISANNQTPQKDYTVSNLSEDLHLTAHWTPIEYKITCKLEGGQVSTGQTLPQTYTIESAPVSLPTPTKEHYVFDGWQDTQGNKTANVTIPTGSTGDKTYTAVWSPAVYDLTLRLDAEDASWTDGSTSKSLVSPANEKVTLPKATEVKRAGYVLEGWSLVRGGVATYTPGQDYSIPEKNAELYAVWRALVYSVSYDLAGGTVNGATSIPNKANLSWSDTGLLPEANPTKEGFEFEGWYTTPEGTGTKVEPETKYSEAVGGDDTKLTTTLYARWTEAEPTIDDKTIKFNTASVTGTDLYGQDGTLIASPDLSQIKAQPGNYLAHVKQTGQSDIWAPVESVQEVNGTQYLKLNVADYYDNNLKQDGLYVQPGAANAQTDLSKIDGYVASNATAYENLRRFMPYYDAKQVIDEGNTLAQKHPDNLLCTKKAIGIFPVDSKGERLVFSSAAAAPGVYGVRVQFDDDAATTATYPLEYVDTRSDIASYRVSDLGVHFNFPKLLVTDTSQSFKDLVSAGSSVTADDLQSAFTREPEKDNNDNKNIRTRNFNESVKPNMGAAMMAYAANFSEEMPLTSVSANNSIAQAVVKSWLSDTTKLKRFLCTYNYLDCWYGFVIGGINMRDVVMFDSSVLPGATNTKNLIITKNCDESGASGRSGGSTQEYYNAFLKGPMGKNSVAEFVEYFMRYYAQERDVNDWIVKNFKHGFVAEAKCENPEIRKRVWSLIKRNSELKNQQMVLPVLSYDTGYGLYMIGLSVGLFWGDMQIYGDYKDNPESAKRIGSEIKNKTDAYNHMLDNFAAFSSRGAARLKQQINLITDQTQTLEKTEYREMIPGSGLWLPVVVSRGEQYRNNDAIKEVILPLGRYRGHRTAGAVTFVSGYADQDYIYFANGTVRYAFSSFEHEMGHLLTIAMCDNRQPRLGNEAINNGYANEGELDLNMNFKTTFGRDSAGLSNLSPDRIMTEEKYKSHFKGEFDNLYLIDHLQAEGYLQLTSAQKAAITSKQSYQNNQRTSVWYKSASGNTTNYWNASEIDGMNLDSFEALYDNHIAVRAGCQDHLTGHGNIDQNSYHVSQISYTSWFEPNNPGGAPDTETYKRNGFLLGGYGGYEEGTIKYLTNKMNGNDQARFNAIIPKSEYPQFYTGDNFDWRKYRLAKESEAAQRCQNNPYFDEDALITYLKNSMANPGTDRKAGLNGGQTPLANIKNARENVYRYLQRATDEYRYDLSGENTRPVQKIGSAQELVEKIKADPDGLYELTADIDMSEVTRPEGQDTYIPVTLIGKLAFKGHTIRNADAPLLNRVSNSYLANVSITNPQGGNGSLAKSEAWCIRVSEK